MAICILTSKQHRPLGDNPNLVSPSPNTALCCRLPLKFCFIKVPVCMTAQSAPTSETRGLWCTQASL